MAEYTIEKDTGRGNWEKQGRGGEGLSWGREKESNNKGERVRGK